MAETVTGGCLCGYVRYKYNGELEAANYCHCQDCRKTTGSAFNVGVRIQSAALRIVAGQVKSYTKNGNSGNKITREFCPECGSPLFTRAPAKPQFVWLKAGSLDNPQLVKPVHQIWTDSAVSWAYIDPELPSFSQNRQIV
ncbi:GFA family protein [Tolypothrix sp. PCC 7910]|uniref:GFA family protein n=1 Tax=Tolypothrix sp. PCC 7910 TaxID=2099387 RepID=UPI00142797C7|nr:GFA family protein [Tolypothrix sp. PCC 7910]QIR35923.1 GFA family protein [Tolypothrix sp. PCC 7910]